jgi:hypothetical protein
MRSRSWLLQLSFQLGQRKPCKMRVNYSVILRIQEGLDHSFLGLLKPWLPQNLCFPYISIHHLVQIQSHTLRLLETHFGRLPWMKSTLLLWTTTHGTWFHFRKEESLFDADGYIEQIFFHMVISASTKL